MQAKGKRRTLGERLSQERRLKSVAEWRDIEQQEIADAVDVNVSTVSRWENDMGRYRDDALMERFAHYFGVRSAYLRYGEEPRQEATAERAGDIPMRTRESSTPPAASNAKRRRRRA